jgi:hypothetical protein
MNKINLINLITYQIKIFNLLIIILDRLGKVDILKKALRVNDLLGDKKRRLNNCMGK